LLDKILGQRKTDDAILLRIYCKAALPDANEKKEAWNELFNVKSKLSKKQKEELIHAFSQRG
jgi:hypothetical protein